MGDLHKVELDLTQDELVILHYVLSMVDNDDSDPLKDTYQLGDKEPVDRYGALHSACAKFFMAAVRAEQDTASKRQLRAERGEARKALHDLVMSTHKVLDEAGVPEEPRAETRIAALAAQRDEALNRANRAEQSLDDIRRALKEKGI